MSQSKKEAPFSEWTRREKRNATLVYQGKRITVLDYIGQMTAFLNSRYKAIARGKPVDHYQQMMLRYMEKGMPAIQEYLDLYRDATAQQTKDLEQWKGETKQLDTLEASKKLDEITGNG